jgi:hypothetical protein
MKAAAHGASLADLGRYFLRLGTLGFGGPIALAGYMQRDLVEEKRWIEKPDYPEGLALAQLALALSALYLHFGGLSSSSPFLSIASAALSSEVSPVARLVAVAVM